MNITKLIFIKSGPQTQQFLRPYTGHINPGLQNEFNNVVRNEQGGLSTAIVDLSSKILFPNPQHQGMISLPGGWENNKLRFFLEIDNITNYAGGKRSQIISGFTDICDVSHMGTLNPNTKLYFNNTLSILQSTIWTSNGQAESRRMESSSHILHSDPSVTMNGPKAVTLRPKDVFSVLASGALDSSSNLIDCNAMLTNGMQIASRRDEFAPSYVERSYKAYNAATSQKEAATEQDLFYTAKNYTNQQTQAFDNFIRALKSGTSLSAYDYVTYEELCSNFPGLDDLAKVIVQSNEVMSASQYNSGSVSGWQGANFETLDANYLIHSLPSLMMDLMISEINIASTNDTLNGAYITTIQGYNGFSNKVDMKPYIQSFITRFEFEYMPMLTKNNARLVKVLLHMDLLGESYIKLQYDNNHAYEFLAPSFCDGFFSPLISNSQANLQQLAGTFNTLLSNVGVDFPSSLLQMPGTAQTIPSFQNVLTPQMSSNF